MTEIKNDTITKAKAKAKNIKPWGMATAIGSLPMVDVEEAVSFVLASLPEIPHWPQLPQRSNLEGLIRQYIAPLLAFGLVEEAKEGLRFAESKEDWSDCMTDFYEAALHGESKDARFKLSREAAPGFYGFTHRIEGKGLSPEKLQFLKGQVTGPVTLGLQITDSQGKPSFYSEELRGVLLEALAMQAVWQVRELQKHGYPVIIFFDDPSLYSYGQSTTVGISGVAITESYVYLARRVKEAGGLAGIHACAGVEWSLVLQTGLDIINADMYNYFPSVLLCAEELDGFLKGGGTLAWGLIPTDSHGDTTTAAELWAYFAQCCHKLAARGVDLERLKTQWLLTPVCGVGSVSPEKAGKVYGLLQEMQEMGSPHSL